LCGSENRGKGIAVIQNLLTCGYAYRLTHNGSTSKKFEDAHHSSSRNYADMDGLLDVFTLDHKTACKKLEVKNMHINHGHKRPRQQGLVVSGGEV